MKIALCCPASLPATQFGGILFLCLDIAKESSKHGHDVTIYTTDLDFANNPKTFNKNLPRKEKIQNFFIKRSHVWLRYSLFYVNPGMYFQLIKDSPDVIHTVGIKSFQSLIAYLVSKKKGIVFVFLGDGTFGEGVVYETLNFCSLLNLKCFFIVENNKIAQSTPLEKNFAGSFIKRFEPAPIMLQDIFFLFIQLLFNEISSKQAILNPCLFSIAETNELVL